MKAGTAVLVLLVLLTYLPPAKGAMVWHTYNGHTYALTAAPGNWLATQAEAESYGGDLVTINAEAENDWLLGTFGPEVEHNVWIGFFQPPGTGEPSDGWEWISGESVAYTNWGIGQPNEHMVGDDYAAMNTAYASDPGIWHDVPLAGWDGPHPGIIEVVPEPTMLTLLAFGGATLLRRRR